MSDPTAYTLRLAARAGRGSAILYQFTTHGPSEERMRRALCFYDKALFKGLQSAELLDDEIRSDPSRPSGMLHASIIKVYNDLLSILDTRTPEIRVVEVSKNRDLLATTSPIVTTLHGAFPKSVTYDGLYSCESCCKVFDQTAGATLCEGCR